MDGTRKGPEPERMPLPLLVQLKFADIVREETDPDALRMLNWWVNPRGIAPSDDPTIGDTFNRLWSRTDREAETNG